MSITYVPTKRRKVSAAFGPGAFLTRETWERLEAAEAQRVARDHARCERRWTGAGP